MIDREMITAWLAVACLAPSPHNNQPWLARATPDGIIVRLDPRQLPALGPDRVQFIGLGAFIENLSYAAAVDGYRLTVDNPPVVPRRTSEIAVRFHGGVKPGDDAASSLAAARRRRTNRGPYLPPGRREGPALSGPRPCAWYSNLRRAGGRASLRYSCLRWP